MCHWNLRTLRVVASRKRRKNSLYRAEACVGSHKLSPGFQEREAKELFAAWMGQGRLSSYMN
jgi:hypothetical protein